MERPDITPEMRAAWRRSSNSGHHLHDIPQPHIRFFPGPQPRRVRVKCSIYYGVGRHYYPWVEEEDNPLWNSRDGKWWRPWRDPEGKGRTLHCYDDPDLLDVLWPHTQDTVLSEGVAFHTHTDALTWCRAVVEKHFAGPEYDVDWSDVENLMKITGPYTYAHEGD